MWAGWWQTAEASLRVWRQLKWHTCSKPPLFLTGCVSSQKSVSSLGIFEKKKGLLELQIRLRLQSVQASAAYPEEWPQGWSREQHGHKPAQSTSHLLFFR